MSDKSKIEWTDATWNPVTGCTKVSQGCKNCYAERVFPRTYGSLRKFTDVRTHRDRLEQPLHWRKPRRIFVNSISDLFHEEITDEFIADVFGIMSACPQHTFQVLTKRARRCADLLFHPDFVEAVDSCGALYTHTDLHYPLPNVWVGVSVEDQATAEERIPLLLQTPAALRWISAEPLLGPIDLRRLRRPSNLPPFARIDWVICGGESGPEARPFKLDSARALRDQCKTTGIPFFLKQIGRRPYSEQDGWSIRGSGVAVMVGAEWQFRKALRDPKGGDMDEWPADLRVREFPDKTGI